MNSSGLDGNPEANGGTDLPESIRKKARSNAALWPAITSPKWKGIASYEITTIYGKVQSVSKNIPAR